jgi:predicted GNAT family acetyltransferase
MSIEVVRFEGAEALREVAEPYLMRHEAEHNLILGLIANLEVAPRIYGPEEPYLAAALKGPDVVAAAVMTPPRPLVLSLCEEEAADAIARDVLVFRRETVGVNAPGPASLQFAQAWRRLTGDTFNIQLAERCYKLTRLRPPRGVPGSARRATAADIELITDWRMAFVAEAVPFDASPRDEVRAYALQQLAAPPERTGTLLWEDAGRPVSMASYGSPTPNSLRIGPVYTPPELRGRGYASACTAAASQYILDSGKTFATLFTDLANPTTNHIYQAIGFAPVCDATVHAFERR